MSIDDAVEHLIFDWNGTLIDDVAAAVAGVNRVRAHQALPAIDIATYRDLFTFPIARFYERLGIDFTQLSFGRLSEIYLGFFNEAIKSCPLHVGAIDVLTWARNSGICISILSASKHDTLMSNLADAGLLGRVNHVFGLEGSEAVGKLDIARRLDIQLGRPGKMALMIGDTDHDVEVALACGWRVSTVSHGHQAAERLAQVHDAVFANFATLCRHHFPQSEACL
jgi:phosphoglycolate phosphatase